LEGDRVDAGIVEGLEGCRLAKLVALAT
jgi:hypothetical protein